MQIRPSRKLVKMSESKKLRVDFTADINNLKSQTGREEEAIEEAKKLRGDIENEMGKSFEMIEESQNEIKGFLHKREKEEEEHRARAARMAKRLEDEIMNVEDDISDNVNNNRQNTGKRTELDSKSVQTDNQVRISKDSQTDESGTRVSYSQRRGPWVGQELNLGDIPDIVESIREDLIENLKMKLANEEEKAEEDEKFDAKSRKQDTSNQALVDQNTDVNKDDFRSAMQKRTKELPAKSFDRKLVELSKAVVENEIRREMKANTETNIDTESFPQNNPTKSNMNHLISNHRNQFQTGLLRNIHSIHEVPGLLLEEREYFADAYGRMKDEFDRLKEFMIEDTCAPCEDAGVEKVTRCRELCKDVDYIEGVLENLNTSIDSHASAEVPGDSLVSGVNDNNNHHIEDTASVDQTSASSLVATLKSIDELDDGINVRKETPVVAVDRQQLLELLEKKMDAKKKLSSKLDDLKVMLGQGPLAELRTEEEEYENLQDIYEKSPMDPENLKIANVRLQKELDMVYKANKTLMDQNAKLCKDNQGASTERDCKIESMLQQIGHIDISRWESDKNIKENLNELKKILGEDMTEDLLNGTGDAVVPYRELKDYASLRLENKNLENLLNEYRDNIMNITGRLIAADVANDINEVIKVDNQNIKRVTEELQRKIKETEEMLVENELLLQGKESILNALAVERKMEIDEEDKLMESRHELEKQLTLANKSIHEFFPLLEVEKQRIEVNGKIEDIDSEIDIIAKELNQESGGESYEKKAQMRRLEKLLEKLKPHLGSKRKLLVINSEKYKATDIPEEFEVDNVIKLKEDLQQRVDENNNILDRQAHLDGDRNYSKNTKNDMDEMISTTQESYEEELQQLKEELKDNMEILENAGLGKDDTVYLREIVESLKVSIKETDENLEDAKRKSANQIKNDEELAEIEEKIDFLTEMHDAKEKDASKDEARRSSTEDITQYNLKEIVGKASERLKEEKKRLEMIVESTISLERERSISTIPDSIGFQKSFHENTGNIKTDIDECIDDVIRVLNSSVVKLQSKEADDIGRLENEALTELMNKFIRLKGGMAEVYRDFKMMEKFEKEGEAGEILDSDVEELIYKIEAIRVSTERMDKTIEEHVQTDGDAKTLEILRKRRMKMKGSQDEAMNELKRRKEVMKKELRELMREKLGIISDIKKNLGAGKISSDEERLAMLELIEDVHFNTSIDDCEDGGELYSYVIQRQRIAEDYKEFVGLGALTEEDGEFLSSMIDSVEVDIQERLGEIFSDCSEYNNDRAYENAYLNSILKNRSELQNALYALEKISEEDGGGAEATKKMGKGERIYKSAFLELRELANDKLNTIEAKIDRLEGTSSQLAVSGRMKSSGEGDIKGGYEGNDKDIEEIVQLVKDECESLEATDKLDEDWNGITASLIDEMNVKNEVDQAINTLFDEREELITIFINTKSSGADLTSDETAYFDQISNADQRILDQKNLYIDMKPTVHSSSSMFDSDIVFEQEDPQENLLQCFFDERDFTIRQLFALKIRESARRLNKDQVEAVESASSLRNDLESRLEQLDEKIKAFGDSVEESTISRTQSPNVFTMMLMIDEEIARLKEEVRGDKLFLHGNFKEGNDYPQNSVKESGGEELLEIKNEINVLTERRELLLLEEGEQKDSMSVEEIIDKKDELERSLEELQAKLVPLERVAQLEKEIEELEKKTKSDDEKTDDLSDKNLHEKNSNIQLQLDDVESTILRYTAAIENELRRSSPLMDTATSSLSPDDIEQVRNVLRLRLDDLINERMKLNVSRNSMSKELNDEKRLQKLVDERKEIVKELDHIENEMKTRLSDQTLAKELHKERQEYEAIRQRQDFLERKKSELENAQRYLRLQNDVSFEDTTSGFSDGVEIEEKNKESSYEKEIDDLKQEVEMLKLLKEKSESDSEGKQEVIMELMKENGDKNETIEKLEEELLRLQKEITELNDAAETMMEVANAMEEQIHEKSLEIELNRDEIKELKMQLKKAESGGWHELEARYDELDAALRTKSKEISELINEKVQMSQEVESLNEKLLATSDELSREKSKYMKLEEQISLLDQLKDELKRKGKRILKIENDELYTMSPTEEDAKDGRQSNDFKNEMDKVSAVEEIMKLAAEMTSENETKGRQCNELEAQKEELTQILEDLLEKCQSQSKEIEDLKKIKETGEAAVRDSSPCGIDKEDDIVPEQHRILMLEPDRGLEDEVDDLRTRVTILSNEKEQLKDEVEDTRFKVDELEGELKSKEKAINSAESQIEELMGTVHKLLAKNNTLEEMHLKDEQLRQKLDIENKEKMHKKDEELSKERDISAERKRKGDNLELEKQALEHELLLKSTKNDYLSKQIVDLEKELEDTATTFNDDKKKLEKQRKMLLDEKEDIARSLRGKCDEILRVKAEVDTIRMNYQQAELNNIKEIKTLRLQLQESNYHGEELQKNFDRMKRAKEKMLVDYEKQMESLLEQIANLRDRDVKLLKDIEHRKESSILLKELERANEELIKNHRQEFKKVVRNKDMEIEEEISKRRRVEEDLEKERYEFKKQKVRFQELDNQKEGDIDKLKAKINKLKTDMQQKEGRIEQLESAVGNFDKLEKQALEDNDTKLIRRHYESKITKLRLDLEEAQHESEVLLERNQKLKKLLAEKELDLSHIEDEYQSEIKDMRKKIVANDIKNEKEKSKETEMGIALMNYEKEHLAKSAYISELYEEKLELNKDLKGLEKLIRQMKEKNDCEKRAQDLRIEELESQNEKLMRKIKNAEKEMIAEIEENNHLKSVKKEMAKVKDENFTYKEKLLEMDRNVFYKEKAEGLENELKAAKSDFEALKKESVQILRHSNAMKNEIKQLKHQLEEMKKEHKKENKLLVSNLEKEFKKKIEEIIKSNLQEKEKMLEMWDEERENWEEEVKEDLESSKHELERQLRLQRMEMEREHMNKLTELMNKNNGVVNELNMRLNELERERKQMEQKLDEEIRLTERNSAAEKEYMLIMICELLKSLVDSKSSRNTMSQNYRSEIIDIEEKFEKEKMLMNMQLTTELNLLRNKVNKMMSTGDVNMEHGVKDLLDFIPRKL